MKKNKNNDINRRKFLEYSAAIACAAPFYSCSGTKQQEKSEVFEKSLIRPLYGFKPSITSGWIKKNDYKNQKNILRKIINESSDFSWLKKGDSVLLKLALNSGNKFPATTDPWVLEVIIKMLQEKGAGKIVVGDKSGVEHVCHFKDKKEGSSRDLCESSGLLKVITENNAIPDFFEEKSYDSYFKSLPENPHHWKEPVWISSIVKEVDHIIYLQEFHPI